MLDIRGTVVGIDAMGCQKDIARQIVENGGGREPASLAGRTHKAGTALFHQQYEWDRSQAIRHHWHIENKLHWSLDMSFNEDACRVRKGYAAENFSRLRRLALNLLKRETTEQVGIKAKRLRAGWDEHYLLKVLTA